MNRESRSQELYERSRSRYDRTPEETTKRIKSQGFRAEQRGHFSERVEPGAAYNLSAEQRLDEREDRIADGVKSSLNRRFGLSLRTGGHALADRARTRMNDRLGV